MSHSSEEPITLARDVEALRIPSGERVPLPAGTEVTVTQALGGTFTVAVRGNFGLYRIPGSEADALGLEPESAGVTAGGAPADEAAVWEQLRNVYDPEIPVNIVDLGLVYSLDTKPSAEGLSVRVKMTLTAPGCGMGPAIAADAKARILALPGVRDAEVELVWDPAWHPSMISPEGKKRLGIE